ncbi:uncharacterized protein [Hoplias malabaricus]|uniref:uncharacterized protein isoform X2 n=1 Tax=Hoplias malabaricus TaxID=27720 RepID=UPI003462AF11
MNHNGSKCFSDKRNTLRIFSKHSLAQVKSGSMGTSDHNEGLVCVNKEPGDNSSPPQKTKRLKTRKERNWIRGQSVIDVCQIHNRSKKRSEEKAQSCSCHDKTLSRPLKYVRKEKAVAKPFPPKRLSFITEGRLTSTRGLFSHEVRSVDIERLVKEQRKQNQGENNQGNGSTTKCPPTPLPLPLNSNLETEEPDISSFLEDKTSNRSRNEMISKPISSDSEGTDPLTGYRVEEEPKTCPEPVDNVISGTPSTNKGTEPIILSSSECQYFQPSSNQNVPNAPAKEQPITTTVAMSTHQTLQNTPALSVQLNLGSGPDSASVGNGQSKKPDVSMDSETISKLAARLCQTLDFPLLRGRVPLLEKCREFLLQTMEKKHSSNLQHHPHKPYSHFSVDPKDLSHISGPACSSSGRRLVVDNTPMQFSFDKEFEGHQTEKRDILTGNCSWREFMREDFSQGAANERRRMQSWTSYSPQGFFTKLQSPCENMGQWGISVPPDSPKEKQHSFSQASCLHQAFTGIEEPKSYSYNFGPSTSDTFFLLPQKQVKKDSSANRLKEVTELLAQCRNDPDLAFLFHPQTELRDWSHHQQMDDVCERPSFGVSSTFFPSEGFRFQPYYCFPRPCSSTNRLESSALTFYNHSDTNEFGLSHLHSNLSYSHYFP